MSFILPQKVLFRHCDPAGIVFYPRYFEMINDCMEAFFEEVVGHSFAEIHKNGAVPTAAISVEFKAMSRLGDRLNIHLLCPKIGRSSLGLETRAICGSELRFLAKSTLVYVNKSGRPTGWPAPIRGKIEHFVKESAK